MNYNALKEKYKRNSTYDINNIFNYTYDNISLYNPVIKEIIENNLIFPETEILIMLLEYLLTKEITVIEINKYFAVCIYVISKKIPELLHNDYKIENLNLEIDFETLLKFIFSYNCNYDLNKLKKNCQKKKLKSSKQSLFKIDLNNF